MLRMLAAPLLGGVIGYFTNDIAIRMLFRPRRAVYLGKWKLPFTPGLIPAQKSRIAASVGAVVSRELLDRDTLRGTLLSEDVLAAVRGKLDGLADTLAAEGSPLRDKLGQYAGEERVDRIERDIRDRGAKYIVEKLVAADAGTTLTRAAVQTLREKQGFGWLAMLTADDGVTRHFGGRLNRLIEQNGEEMLRQEIARLEDELLSRPVGEWYGRYEDKAEMFKDEAMRLYRYVIEEKLGEMLAVADVEKIVVDKINAFSAEELENLIFAVMKKELRAIVYLGALLGFLMGFFNLLF